MGSKKALRIPKTLSILLSAVLLVSSLLIGNVPVKATGGVEIAFDLSNSGKVIENKFSDMNAWDLNSAWTSGAKWQPTNYFSSKYPFVKRYQLMTATGGSLTRDLFKDPNDRSTLTDYKFDSLILACHNIINQGLKPEIITGNVPLKFSTNPSISTSFGVNVRPPDDYNQYYTYIKAIGDALVTEFGIEEMKTWSWGVLTEYENKDWFCDADGTAASSKVDYFKLYDFTVAALQDAIGVDNLEIGAHGMVVAKGLWDVGDFIDHCAFGTNYKTGGVGTQINFLSASYYDTKPGQFSSKSLDATINQLRDRAVADGLTGLKFGVDEGRLLRGADGKELSTREVAMSYQGAADARQFKDMIENNIDWFSRWGLNTTSVWSGIDSVGTHVANLGYKMTGDKYITPTKTGSPLNSADQVEAIGGFNSQAKTAHFMLYNFNPSPAATTSEPTTITINNVGLIDGSKVTVKQWIVDDTHGNFWPAWWQDMADNGITSSSFSWSQYCVTVPGQLKSQTDRAVWNTNAAKYAALAELKSTSTVQVVTNGTITLSPTLDHHAVVFYEITEKQDLQKQITLTDDLNNWSLVNDRSNDLGFSTANASVLGDPTRVVRTSNLASPAQYINYKMDTISGFTVIGLFASGMEPISDFKFYTSPDGTNWTEQKGVSHYDIYINSNSWTKRVYSLKNAPEGTKYLQILFPVSGANSWNPQLSQVVLLGASYKPGDASGDNQLDLMDVTIQSRYVASWSGQTCQTVALDVNADSIIDLLDITTLSRYIAGWDVTLQ